MLDTDTSTSLGERGVVADSPSLGWSTEMGARVQKGPVKGLREKE
jgi:hypothetical protein